MCNRTAPAIARRQAGASIVELMVGMVVALLVGLAATGSALTFSAAQRQGLAAGGVAVNATSVLAALKDDVAGAGLGFFGGSAYLCSRLNLSHNGTVVTNGSLFSPLQVTRQATADVIDVVYGTRVESGANVRLAGATVGTDALLASYLPVSNQQAVLLSPAAGTPGVAPCLVRTITSQVASTATSPQQLVFAAAGQHNGGVFTNLTNFDDEGRVTSVGQLQWSRYQLNGTNLELVRPLDNNRTVVIARDVIAFRIQYGVSTGAGATALDDWVDPGTAPWVQLDSTNLPRVRAVRIGVIVRSPAKEKPDSSGTCSATETKPSLFDATPENLSNADWNCYRYRTATVVVPMRNIVMGLR